MQNGVPYGIQEALVQDKSVARIRTSDRASFRRCRRRWNWSSHLRHNLESNRISEPFWLGKGFHYALEDYHGYNVYGNPVQAFEAFVQAWRRVASHVKYEENLPDNLDENYQLGIGMFKHYLSFLERRDPLNTYWYNGVPQCEVRFEIPLPFDPRKFGYPYDEVIYGGTLDRVIIDDYGRLWIVEYKTAKAFNVTHFDVDNQITAYCWAAGCIYDKPIAGVIYQQHLKDIPEPPKLLASGLYSANKQQRTTWNYYHTALKNLYDDVQRAPKANIEMLNHLAELETEDKDTFVRRDRVERNAFQMQAEGDKILLEMEDMLNPNLPLYPNPTRDCSWDCSAFNAACIMLDSGDDWETELAQITKQRQEVPENWRDFLPHPDQLLADKLEQENYHE